jgi:hypothetical protein
MEAKDKKNVVDSSDAQGRQAYVRPFLCVDPN